MKKNYLVLLMPMLLYATLQNVLCKEVFKFSTSEFNWFYKPSSAIASADFCVDEVVKPVMELKNPYRYDLSTKQGQAQVSEDSDQDGVQDELDLDDDNDGILDIHEMREGIPNENWVSTVSYYNGATVIGNRFISASDFYNGGRGGGRLSVYKGTLSNGQKAYAIGGVKRDPSFSVSHLDKRYIESDITTGDSAVFISGIRIDNKKVVPPYLQNLGVKIAVAVFDVASSREHLIYVEGSNRNFSDRIYRKIDMETAFELQPNSDYQLRIYLFGRSNTSASPQVWLSRIYVDTVLEWDLGYRDLDTDGDGIVNRLDTDSDNDGCFDAIEAKGNVSLTELNSNGSIDTSNTGGVDADGVPNLVNAGGTSDTDHKQGQSLSVDCYKASKFAIDEATFTDQTTTVVGGEVTFSIDSKVLATEKYVDGVPNYAKAEKLNPLFQWQENGVDLKDGGVYRGTKTSSLYLSNTTGLSGNVYTVVMRHPGNKCLVEERAAKFTYQVDSDGDGIADVDDLDDDNDGILDDEERVCFSYYESFGVGSGQMLTSHSNVPSANVRNVRVGTNTDFNGLPWYETQSGKDAKGDAEGRYLAMDNPIGTSPVLLYKKEVEVTVNENYLYSLYATAPLEEAGRPASQFPDVLMKVFDSNGVELSEEDSGVLNLEWTYVEMQFTSTTPKVSIEIYNRNTTSVGNTLLIDEINISLLSCDTDDDGIINSLDLDSDNDGCFDALEAGGNVTSEQLTSTGRIDIATTGGVDSEGVPNLVNNGEVADVDGKQGQEGSESVIRSHQISIERQVVSSLEVCEGEAGSLSIDASLKGTEVFIDGEADFTSGSPETDKLKYQWQVKNASANTWSIIESNEHYKGVSSKKLTIINIPSRFSGNTYRVQLSSESNECTILTSDQSELFVTSSPQVDNVDKSKILCVGTLLTTIEHAVSGVTGLGTPENLPSGVEARLVGGTTVKITGSPLESGVFNYRIPLMAQCGDLFAEGSITVLPESTVDNLDKSQTVCVGTLLTSIEHSVSGVTGLGTPENLPSGVAARLVGGTTVEITGSPLESGVFNYRIPLIAQCGDLFAEGSITILPQSTVDNLDKSQTVCVGTLLTTIEHSVSGVTGLGTPENLPSGVEARLVGGTTVEIIGTPSESGVFNYRIPLTAVCGNVLAEGSITVLPQSTVDNLNKSQRLCVGTLLTTIEHSVSGVTGLGTPENLPSGVQARLVGGTAVEITGTPSESGVFNYRIPLIAQCGDLFAEGSITVLPQSTVDNLDKSQTVCVGTLLTTIEHVTTGVSGIGITGGLPSGVTAKFQNDEVVISGSPSESGVFNYRIPLTAQCGDLFAEGSITVLPQSTVDNLGKSQTVCVGTLLTTIEHSVSGVTGLGTPENLPSGVAARLVGGTTVEITGTPSESGVFNYRIPLTAQCGNLFAEGSITVLPQSTVDNVDKSQSLCVGTLLTTIEHSVSGVTGLGTPENLPSGVAARLEGGTTVEITGSPSESGVFDYRIPLTAQCGNLFAEGRITVIPQSTVDNVDKSQSLCVGILLTTIEHSVSGVTGLGTPENLPSGVEARLVGGTTVEITGTPSESGVFDYRIPLTAQCGNLFAEGSITVLPQSTVDNVDKSQRLCVGSLLTTIEHSVSGVTGLGKPENLPSGVQARLVGGTTVEITGTPSESGVFNYRIPLAAECGNLFAEGSITVLPESTVDNVDKSQSLCVGTLLTTIEHAVSGVTGLGAPENLPSGVQARLVGGTTVEITGTPSESGVFNYRIPLTAVCGNVFAEGSITVLPQSTVDNVDKSQSLCVGTLLATIEHSVSGVTGLGAPENLPSGVEARLVGGTTVEITGTPSESGVFNYRIPLTAECGNLFAEGSITVLPQSTVDNVDKSQSLCVGTLLTTIEHSVSGVTGLGTPENLPSGVAARLIGGTSVEITGTPYVSGVFNYRIPLTAQCGDLFAEGSITVIPQSTVDNVDKSQSLCVGTLLTTIEHSVSGVTGLGAPENLPSGVEARLVGGTTVEITGTPSESGVFNYRIPLTAECGNLFAEGSITVLPQSTVDNVDKSQSLCVGTLLTTIEHAVSGVTGLGTPENLPSGVAARLIGGTSVEITGTPYVSGVFNYRIPLTAQCGDLFAEGSITVIPQSTVDNVDKSQSLCVGTLLTTIEHSVSGVTGLGAPENLPSGVQARLVGGTTVEITGTPSESGVFNYRIPLAAECGNLFAEGSITVLPQSTVDNLNKSESLCVGTLLTTIEHSVSGVTGLGAPENLPSGVQARLVGGTTVEITGTPSESGVFNYRIPLAAECGNLFAEGSITVLPQSTVDNLNKSESLCVGTLLTTIEHSVSGVTGLGTPDNLPSGVAARLVGGTTVEITGSPSESGVFNYRIPLTAQCGDLFAEGSITVLPQSTVDNVDKSQRLCVGSLLTTIEHLVSGVTGLGTPENLPSGVEARLVGGTTVEITGTPSVSGVFDYRIPLTAQCGDLFAEGSIAVLPQSTVDNVDKSQRLCMGTLLTTIEHSVSGVTGLGAPENLPSGVQARLVGGTTVEITGTPSVSGVFNYRIPLTAQCGNLFAEGSITVLPQSTVDNVDKSQSLCVGSLLTTIEHSVSGVTGLGAPENLPSGVQARLVGGTTVEITGTPSVSGVFNYRIPLTAQCGNLFAEGSITVLPQSTVDNLNKSQRLCVGSLLTTIEHSVSGVTGLGTPENLPSGVAARLVGGTTVEITGSPSESGVFNYRIPLTAECGNLFAEGSITVILQSTVDNVDKSQSLCVGTLLTTIEHLVSGVTGLGTPENLPSGVQARLVGGTTVEITGTPSVSGVFDYRIPLTAQCGDLFAEGSIAVLPQSTVDNVDKSQSLCVGTLLTTIEHSVSGVTGLGTPENLPSGVQAGLVGGTNVEITGTPSESGVFNYRIPLVAECGNLFAEGSITVIPQSTVDNVDKSQSLCVGTLLTTIEHSVSGVTGLGTPENLPSGVAARLVGGTTVEITGTPSVSGVFNYRIPLKAQCGDLFAEGNITVIPQSTVDNVDKSQSLCMGSLLTTIEHSVSGVTGLGKPENLPSGVEAGLVGGTTVEVTGSPLESGVFDYRIPLIAQCGDLFVEGKITVFKNNTVSTGSSQPEVFYGDHLPVITHKTTGINKMISVKGLPRGVTAQWKSGLLEINGIPVQSGVFNYSISMEGNCGVSIATGIIKVRNKLEVRADDFMHSSFKPGDTTSSVLANDTLNGQMVKLGNGPDEVSMFLVKSSNVLELNNDGTIFIKKDIPSGIYKLRYELCDHSSLQSCKQGEVTIRVLNELLVVDDGFKKPPLLSGLTSSPIFANDSFRGTPIILGDKELQLTVKTFGLPLGIELLTDGTLSISSQVRKGIYHFEYQLCENFSNPRNCKTATVVVFIDEDKDGDGIADSLDNQIVPCFTAYSYLTPNDDGKNDVLIISCLNESNYKNNDIKIYNRWGSLVYKKHGYQNNWNGISEASTTISSGSRLPTGTYYYVFDPGNGNSPRVGWIYLSTE